MENINILAKEGYKSIIIALSSALILDFIFGFDCLSIILYIVTIALIFMYRNPERTVHTNQNEFLSPVDGSVNSIDIKDEKKYIYIDVSLCNVHLLRSPIDADLKVKDHIKGLNLPAFKYKAKKLNERMTLDFGKLKVKLLSGLFNTELKFKDMDHLSKGERIGAFLNGTVMIELENDEKLFVKIGDKVKAGETVLGAFTE